MNKKQSLFHIAKRDTLPWYKSFAIRGCAILLALVVCAVVTMLLTGENPVNIFATIFKGAFGSARKSWVTFQNLAVLLGISLAVTPAFKMRFWNIGAEGQVLIGCLATAACMICLADKLPNAVLILVSLAAALAAGALWGFLPAFFKAKWNTNETLFTLMMNYIATQLAAFFIIVWEVPKGAGKIGIINQGTEAGWLPVVGGQKYLLVILVVAVLTVFMYIYLNYSKHGYEIAVVGESQRTASYAGIKVERVIVRTMVLSGAVCGLMGLLLTAGTDHTLTTKGGEIFVLDMGEPVKILDLAKNLILLSGHKPDEDIHIIFTGLRPGEKLYEEMLMDEEGMQDTANNLIHIGKPIELDEEKFMQQLEELKEYVVTEPEDIRECVKKIVPTYHPELAGENK